MAVYRFRVTFEDHDDVTRDIDVKPTNTFLDFHQSIQKAIGFDGSKDASFYMSDDNWKKGFEITTRQLNEGEESKAKNCAVAKLSSYIIDPHQKIYYEFDPAAKWSFRVELIKIVSNETAGAEYPLCIRTAGEAPKQYIITTPAAVPDPEDFDAEAVLLDDEPELETDDMLALGEDEAETIAGMSTESDEEEEREEGSDEEVMDEESGEEDEKY